VLGSILTRQYRFATRGIEIGLRTAHQAIALGEGIVGGLAGRLGRRNGRGEGDVVFGDVVPEPTDVAPEPRAASPPPPPPPASAPGPPPAPATAPQPPPRPTPAPEPPPAPEPSHVSTEPELVEESAEPGAEDGAGAQVRIGEPWPGYRGLKARDVVARLPFATREELAAVELFERAGANRKSVVVAAQRALKKASPPR
jgi:outer membrane biosynthesis protein TonB